jgi:hypothetical protein
MILLDEYEKAREKVFNHFGYKEDWAVIPLDDATKYYWYLDGDGYGDSVYFADTEEELSNGEGNYYSNEIYTQCHLPKWVYRTGDYTMISVDTHTDGNKFLQIFDNKKERPQ